jgi:hypothetical protein
VEIGIGPGFAGPYDGGTYDLRSRVWLSRELALQVRAGFGGTQHFYTGTLTARLPH